MNDDTEHDPGSTDILDCARQAEDALRRLARINIQRPSTTPADIDVVLGQLAGAVAALPQAAAQLSDMLGNSPDDFDLAMDTLTNTVNSAIAIDTARFHLDAIREPAVEVHRYLNAAAHQQTAHISASDPVVPDIGPMLPPAHRPEHRQPSARAGGRPGPAR